MMEDPSQSELARRQMQSQGELIRKQFQEYFERKARSEAAGESTYNESVSAARNWVLQELGLGQCNINVKKPVHIEQLLWSAAVHEAARFSHKISEDCVPPMQEFIRGGVKRMVEEDVIENQAYIALAETNITSFTLRMIIEAERTNMDDLQVGVFFSVRDFLCPDLWPFC